MLFFANRIWIIFKGQFWNRTIAYFKYLLYFRYVCNSVLPEWEIQKMFYSLVVIVEDTFISGYG